MPVVAKNLKGGGHQDTPPTSGGQGKNHAIRKSYSVGGVGANVKAKTDTPGLFFYASHQIEFLGHLSREIFLTYAMRRSLFAN